MAEPQKQNDQDRNDQDQRTGGYGGSSGAGAGQSSATGRETPVTDANDADEALGNRTGGYGGNPASTDDAADGGQDAS